MSGIKWDDSVFKPQHERSPQEQRPGTASTEGSESLISDQGSLTEEPRNQNESSERLYESQRSSEDFQESTASSSQENLYDWSPEQRPRRRSSTDSEKRFRDKPAIIPLFPPGQEPITLLSLSRDSTPTRESIPRESPVLAASDSPLTTIMEAPGPDPMIPHNIAKDHAMTPKARHFDGRLLTPSDSPRLKKISKHDDEEGSNDSSSSDASTSEEESWGKRGRNRERRHSKGSHDGEKKVYREEESEEREGSTEDSLKSLIRLAEKRLPASTRPQARAVLGQEITSSIAERIMSKKPGVHPTSNFSYQESGQSSPDDSDAEDISDIKRAQKLAINKSPIDTTVAHRAIRTIVRGEFGKMQQEAEEGNRRLRTYLVATDLSSEAAYALEWTIGTVMRDGDTLIAVYAVDEEAGTGKPGEVEDTNSVPIGGGGAAMVEAQAAIGRLTAAARDSMTLPNKSALSSIRLESRERSRNSSSDSRSMTKRESERLRAVEDITSTCIQYLRRTKLQVRIAVEVIHCKNPKYMITEAIDILEPTLVILGSRGRSALKGILLGSFSNYLVSKSSVPVMVARKKLQTFAKRKNPKVRLANNITASKKTLAEAIIDL